MVLKELLNCICIVLIWNCKVLMQFYIELYDFKDYKHLERDCLVLKITFERFHEKIYSFVKKTSNLDIYFILFLNSSKITPHYPLSMHLIPNKISFNLNLFHNLKLKSQICFSNSKQTCIRSPISYHILQSPQIFFCYFQIIAVSCE